MPHFNTKYLTKNILLQSKAIKSVAYAKLETLLNTKKKKFNYQLDSEYEQQTKRGRITFNENSVTLSNYKIL